MSPGNLVAPPERGGSPTMNISYFKRFRMEIDLNVLPPVPRLPEGYTWLPWNDVLQECHAEVKFQSFEIIVDIAKD